MKTQIKKIIVVFFLLNIISIHVFAGGSDQKTKSYPIKGINGIDINIACELYIEQKGEESLRIDADEDIIHHIEVKKRDSVLYLTSDKDKMNYKDKDIEVYISVKTLNQITVGGAAKIRNSGILKSNKFTLDISGAADLNLEIDVEKLLADFSGAVNADLRGKANYVVMDMSGASKVDADDLISEAFYLDFSGFGKAEVYAEKVLKVDMSGMGVVKYGGNPQKVDANSSGLGVVKPR